MVMRGAYVVARGAGGRPLCMHRLEAGVATRTACGEDLSPYSRSYTTEPLDAILCKRNACYQAPTGKARK